MREQPHYTNLLTKDFFENYYVKKRMSYPKIREMLLKQGYNIHVGTLHSYAKKVGIGRTSSEAKRNREKDPLDWNKSYMTEKRLEHIDGFLLGDGYIESSPKSKTGRLSCGVQYEEFCRYLIGQFTDYKVKSTKYDSESMSFGYVWSGSSRFHPDLYIQRQRWYPKAENNKFIKQPPDDVRITPKSVMMWYLGDGTLVHPNNTVTIRLSTDGFAPDKVRFLVNKLKEKNIDCYRTNENRIRIRTAAVPSFFDFIGRKSPIKCYSYKFDLPEWRFQAKRMKQVATELNIDYQRVAYLVKIGKIPCYRIKKNGRPRFLPEHIDAIKKIFKIKG